MEMRATTLMNVQGDVTITWTEDRDAEFEAAIEKKMAEGCVFFIIEPRPLMPPKLTLLKNVKKQNITEHRALLVKDEHFAALVGLGAGTPIKTPEAPVKTVRKARTAKEASKAQTVGVTPLRGG